MEVIMLITEKYQKKIAGVISCPDRIVIQGTLPGWCYPDGMTAFLHSQKIKIFDYPKWANTLREIIRTNAERIAIRHGIEIEFIRKIDSFRKEARIKEILKKRGMHPGLVHIFSAMESCTSYKPWHDKTTHRTFLKYDSGKCLHYYFYFIDKEFGLCYIRVPTWAPFRLQFYCNGHNWLANLLDKCGIPYMLNENAFLSINDFETAQRLADSLNIHSLHLALNKFADIYCPVATRYHISYHFSIMQLEYATDIIFSSHSALRPLYDPLVRTAIHSVKPENIATFLGRRLHPNYQGEMGNNFNTRIEGTRIRHQMGDSSIKMYDKFGIILRIETTTNNVSDFKQYRTVYTRRGEQVKKIASVKKSIYSLPDMFKILKSSNHRYLEFISTLVDVSGGIKNLEKITRSVESDDRTYRGFNFYDSEDLKLLEVLSRGEFNINGFRNKLLRQYLPHKNSGAISRILKRLHLHGMIRKIAKGYKYYVTSLGKTVIAAGLTVRNMVVIPKLAHVA